MAKDFIIFQNYPNPFNPTTTISYTLNKKSYVRLTVYNLLGEKIQTLVNQEQNPGEYKTLFYASHLPSGIYYYQLESDGTKEIGQMLLLK